MTAFGDFLATFDVRKPAIIISKSLILHEKPHKLEEDFNDFDFCHTSTGHLILAACDDSGLTHVYQVNPD